MVEVNCGRVAFICRNMIDLGSDAGLEANAEIICGWLKTKQIDEEEYRYLRRMNRLFYADQADREDAKEAGR